MFMTIEILGRELLEVHRGRREQRVGELCTTIWIAHGENEGSKRELKEQ